jgi:hypothetical protein
MYSDEPFHEGTSLQCHVHDDQERRVALDYWCIFVSKVRSVLVNNSSEPRQIYYAFPSRLDADADHGTLGILCSGVGAINDDGSLEGSVGSLLGMLSKSGMVC